MTETPSQHYCHLQDGDTLSLVVAPIYITLSICAIIGNTFVIASVVLFSNLRTPTNNFVVALALADLTVGLSIPYYISFYFNVPYTCNVVACEMRYFICMLGSILSLLLLIGVAVDRYISIMHPLQYPVLGGIKYSFTEKLVEIEKVNTFCHNSLITDTFVAGCFNNVSKRASLFWMTHRVACVTITFISIYVTGVMSLPFELSSAHKDLKLMRECDLYYVYTPVFTAMSIVFHLVLFLIVTFILYGRIFRVALQQNRAIAALHPDKKEAKLTLMMVLILGVNLISAVPYLIVVGVRYVEGDHIKDEYEFQLSQIKKVTVLFFYLKSAVNPVIYGWKNRDFRAAFYRLFAEIRCKKNPTETAPA